MKGLKKIEFTSTKMQEIVEDYINASLLHPDSSLITIESIDVQFGIFVVNLKEQEAAPRPLEHAPV